MTGLIPKTFIDIDIPDTAKAYEGYTITAKQLKEMGIKKGDKIRIEIKERV